MTTPEPTGSFHRDHNNATSHYQHTLNCHYRPVLCVTTKNAPSLLSAAQVCPTAGAQPWCLACAHPLWRGMDLGTGMQGEGGGRSWSRMLNKQFFLTTNPGTCSHHVMARDDLLSTKHDQAISGAVSVYLNSNGGSLSICLLLKSKRSIGLCIFSLMNSLFPTFFFFSSFLRPEPSQKAK